MFLSSTRFLIFVGILLVVLFSDTECKRGGGGRRGSVSRGSTSVWGRSRQSQSHDLRNNQRKSKSQPSEADLGKQPAPLPDASKPSAPPAPSKTDATKLTSKSDTSQQTPGISQQRPIGWDVNQKSDGVPNKNIGWNTNNPTSGSSPGNPPPYSGVSGNVGNHPPPYSSSSGHVGNPPPPYPGTTGNVGNYPPPYSSGGGHIGNPPPPYSGPNYAPGSNYNHGQGYHNPNYMSQPGPYYHNGYGGAPMGGGFFGGNKYNQHGFGGFGGGYGGYGGYGMGGYGKKFGGGFGSGFGKHAVRNVVMGLLVWNLVSGLTRRPYNVYNYYNNPEKVPEEIPLPANTIVMCPENVTTLCAPNTAALCTSNDAIMCVVLAQKTVPCAENSTLKCANSTATCTEDDETPCDGKKLTTTSVNIPCITNATIVGKVKENSIAGIGTADTTDLCVTTLALPQTEEEQKALNATECQTENSNLQNGTSTTPCHTTTQLGSITTPLSVDKVELNSTTPK